MLWAIFPIFAQLFYTSGSYIQNFLADVAFPKNRAGALIIMHLPYFVVGMILMYAIFGRIVLILPLITALGFVLAGAINVFGSIFAYKALQAGDAADVIIFSQLSPLISLGLGVPECARIMSRHECWQAMNLDGGTSAMIWYDGEYIMKSSNPVLEAGRTLPNAFVYAKSSDG